jgi:hypothetical protein
MISYEIPQFDQLDRGRISLSVPVVAGAVQIGALNFTSKVCLVLDVDVEVITIGRESGVPLQIQAVSDDEMLTPCRWTILGQPVAQLALHKGDNSGRWSVKVDSEVQVREPRALGEFFAQLASFSLEKQIRQKERLAAKALVDQFLAQDRELRGYV